MAEISSRAVRQGRTVPTPAPRQQLQEQGIIDLRRRSERYQGKRQSHERHSRGNVGLVWRSIENEERREFDGPARWRRRQGLCIIQDELDLVQHEDVGQVVGVANDKPRRRNAGVSKGWNAHRPRRRRLSLSLEARTQ